MHQPRGFARGFSSLIGDRPGARRELVLFVLMIGVSNVSAYLFHVVMVHLLGGDGYSALAAIVGILTITSVPLGAVQAVVARRVATAERTSDAAREFRSAARMGALAGVGLAVAAAAASPLLGGFLRIDPVDIGIALIGLALPTCLSPVGRGALQGQHRFIVLSMSFVAQMGLRVIFGTAFVAAGLGVRGAVLGLVAAEFVSLAVTFLPTRSLAAHAVADRQSIRSLFGDSATTATALAAFWTLVSIDVILARSWLPSAAAGVYATAALAGKTVLYLSGTLVLLVFPSFAKDPRGAHARRILAKSVSLIAVAGPIVAAGILLLPSVGTLAFGPEFPAAAGTAALLACSMSLFGIANILMYHALARRAVPIRTMWVAVVAEIAAISVFHSSPIAVAAMTLVAAVIVCLALGSVTARATLVLSVSEGPLWSAPDASRDLSVVIPAYNGADAIAHNVDHILKTLDAAGVTSEVIVVSDGSTDGTPAAVRAIADDRVRVVHYPTNRGKGFALRTGLAQTRGVHVAFIDSDGDMDPADLGRFLRLVQIYHPDLVVGSKRHPLSQVSYPRSRRAMSRAYHSLVRVLFHVKVSDTQTGIKLMRREALAAVLPRLVEKRFAFDLELIVAMRRAGFTRIVEAPVHVNFRFTSTVDARAVTGILLDTLSIWYRRFIVRQYEGPVSAEPDRPAVREAVPAIEVK